MAEGLIPYHSHSLDSPQDIGKIYLRELVSRSLFHSNGSRYSVHDLVHDLAKYIAGDACSIVQADESIKIPQFCHCLTFILALNITISPKEFRRMKTLRTLLFFGDRGIEEVPREMFDSLSKLRALDFSGCPIRELPDSIGSLKHLKYINLSGAKIEMLPESVTRLQKLDSLELDGCGDLQELPTGLSNMTNLREIKISTYSRLTHMPMEMGKLTKLQKLSVFIVDEERGSSIAELGHLKDLGGELKILNLGKLKDPRVARNANLKEKRNIRSLDLVEGENKFVDDCVAMEVLEGLEPPQNIMELRMNGGTEFPGWLNLNMTESSFPNLIDVTLENFRGCKHLPPLGQLKPLERLVISGMGSIEVVGREFCGNNGGVAFPSLKKIKFKEMPKWKTWLSSEEDGNIGQQTVAFTRLTELPCLPCLTELTIRKCPGLTSLPCLPCLTELTIDECPGLTSLPCLPCLTELTICECPGLTSLPRLPSLQMLRVEKSMKLLKSAGSLGGNGSLKRLDILGEVDEDVGVLEGLQDLSSVEELHLLHFDDLDSVMDSMQHLFSTVLILYIHFCRKLLVLPETMRGLVSLQSLTIWACDRLSSLGEGLRGLTALTKLSIVGCKELGCMPEYMGSLTSLQSLRIVNCPDLKRRCEREKGEDWHLISHIPNIRIYPRYEEEAIGNPQSKKKGISVVKERLSACIHSSTSST
ncbi:hypothetical protein QJS04_geneDACA015140 [Acorus gramineus]|uniref:Uncharacterized protein n=1 Tax=Acorus gramineus TaxID=55184 RepID=A0AAV9BW81_ACOGR|nr:hypothetical protein QJS04_geneDACA015140 [Acorus gramineus]